MDRGQQETERILKSIEKRINHEYATAMREIEDELSVYFAKFEKKDETWRRWVASGERTKEEYQQWRIGQMAVGRRWADQKESIAKQLVETSKTSLGFVRKYSPEIYAENFNYSTYQVEHMAGINTPFTLWSKESVNRIVEQNPDIAPPVGKKLAAQIAEGKAVKWNKQQLQSVMIQGILQGDSIPKLATRLATKMADKDRKASIRNARTISTGVQNAGRVDAYKRAEDIGVDLEQMWMATMDNRTRHSHRWLDGEVRPVGEAFSNGCEYPADPKGDPAEIYNCRCSLRGVVKGLQPKARQYRDTSAVGGMSYDEWRNAKAESAKITAPDEKSKSAKQGYLDIYKGIDKKTVNNGGDSFSDNTTDGIMRRGQIDTGYKGRISSEDMEAFNKQALQQIIKDTGYSEQEARKLQDALLNYFGGDYENIETSPNSDLTKTIIDGLGKMPAYDGAISRGIILTNDDVKAFTSLKAGDSVPTKGVIESWSSNEDCARAYASIGQSVDRSSVIFECRDNTKGKGTQHISKFNDVEAEVMVANPNYEVVEVITESKYDYLSKHRDQLYFGDDLIEEEENLKEAVVCKIIVKEKD